MSFASKHILYLFLLITVVHTSDNECATIVESLSDDWQSYYNSSCIPIVTLPISLRGDNCYKLTKNFTLAEGDYILIDYQNNIQLYFDNYELLVTKYGTPIYVTNSINIHIYKPLIRAQTQKFGTNSIGINIDSSNDIHLAHPTIQNMTTGVLITNSKVRMLDIYIIGSHPGNGTNAQSLSGITIKSSPDVRIYGGYISIPYLAQATPEDGLTTGIMISDEDRESLSNINLDMITLKKCGIYIDVKHIRQINMKDLTVEVDINAFFGHAIKVHSIIAIRSVIIKQSIFNCRSNNYGGDCILLQNIYKLEIEDISMVGYNGLSPNNYRKVMIHIDEAKMVILRNICIRLESNNIVGIRMSNFDPVNRVGSIISNVRIDGGLIGVLVPNMDGSEMFDGIEINNAFYGFVFINGSKHSLIKNCRTHRCYVDYVADTEMYPYSFSLIYSQLTEEMRNTLTVGFDRKKENLSSFDKILSILAVWFDQCFICFYF